MRLRRSRLIGAALLGSALCLLIVPGLAGGDTGQGATHSVETFTEPANFFGLDECTGKTITGAGTQSGTALITETSNGGVHVRVNFAGSVDLYEANGPGPSDPQPGAFVGTWTFQGTTNDEAGPDGQGSTTGITSGPFVFPDGTSARRQSMFHLTWEKNGPPKIFFAHFVCAGN